MIVLPILTRELRVRSRSRATYWTRFAAGLVGVIVCLPQLVGVTGSTTPASVGRYVFDGLLTAAFLLSCCACLFTIDAIHSERSEGTLGLLFLTRVRALDVLLGKLASAGIGLTCTLVAFLPVMALPILAGGVTLGEAFRKWLAITAALFLAVATGLYAASVQEVRTKAWRRAALVMVIVVLLPAWLSQLYSGAAPGSHTPWLALPSPLMTLLYGGDVAYRSASQSYWLSIGAVGGLGALMLLLARTGLIRSLRQGPTATPLSAEQSGPAAHPLPLAPPWLAAGEIANPVERLFFRQRGLHAAVWTAATLSALFQTGLVPLYPYAWRIMPFRTSWFMLAQVPFMAVSVISGALLAWVASRFFVEARRTGELELLLTTPQGAATIVSGQWQALKRILRWPVVVMTTPLFLRAWLLLQYSPLAPVRSRSFYGTPFFELSSVVLGATATLLGVVTVCWLGMAFGLRARGQAGAIVWTVGLARGVPHLISIGWSMLMMAVATTSGSSLPRTYRFQFLVPPVVILLGYFWLVRWAKRRLATDLAGEEENRLPLGGILRFTKPGDVVASIRRARHWTPSQRGKGPTPLPHRSIRGPTSSP